jgi:hypothetical protein
VTAALSPSAVRPAPVGASATFARIERRWLSHALALPLAIWAAATRGRDLPPPTVDVFPFSYHRIVGLRVLLWATAPGRAAQKGAI